MTNQNTNPTANRNAYPTDRDGRIDLSLGPNEPDRMIGDEPIDPTLPSNREPAEPTIASFAAVGPGWRASVTIDRSYRCELTINVTRGDDRKAIASAIGQLVAPDWTPDRWRPAVRTLPTSEDWIGQIRAVADMLDRCTDLELAGLLATRKPGQSVCPDLA